jgi:Coiled-coil domain-containing protein 124 /Oxs1
MASLPHRAAGEQWASGLDTALSELAIGAKAGGDRFPEKRMKAAYK